MASLVVMSCPCPYAEGELVNCTLRRELWMKHLSVCISELFIKPKGGKKSRKNATNHVRLHSFSISRLSHPFSSQIKCMWIWWYVFRQTAKSRTDPGLLSADDVRSTLVFSFSSSFVTVPQPWELHVWTQWTSVERTCTKDFITFP